jgi:hypothetical protein
MAKTRDMRSALGASLKAEENRVAERKLDRFALAEAVLGSTEDKTDKQLQSNTREKVIRDSFSLPSDDYARLRLLRDRGLKCGVHINKSELVRAGLQVLQTLPDSEFLDAVQRVQKLKTGRPAEKTV